MISEGYANAVKEMEAAMQGHPCGCGKGTVKITDGLMQCSSCGYGAHIVLPEVEHDFSFMEKIAKNFVARMEREIQHSAAEKKSEWTYQEYKQERGTTNDSQ